MKKIFNRKKHFIIQILFWTLVGTTSGLLYDLEWFIQHVVIFNGKLSKDLGHGNLSGVSTISDFYKGYNSPGPLQDYYNHNIQRAFQNEGLIFMFGALTASFISGPLLAWGTNKKKNYVLFVIPTILLFSILIASVAPILSTVFLLWAIFTPLFGLGYSYRTVLDPWGTSYARKTGVRISFVRSFYEIGAAVIALIITQIYSQYNFHLQSSGYSSGIAFYVLAIFLMILAMFLLFFIPNKELFEQEKKTDKAEHAFSNKTLKEVLKSRTFIVGTIIFLVLIGTTTSFKSIWVNTTENISQIQEDPKSVVQIGYMKSFSVLPRFIIALSILKLYKKFSLKNLLIITSILATFTWFTIGSLIYVLKLNAVICSLLGGIAEASVATFAVLLGYEFVSKITNVKNRTITFVVFNTIAYGVGSIIFVGINTFFSKTKMGSLDPSGGLIVWYIMGIMSLIGLLLTITIFKDFPKENKTLNKPFKEVHSG